MYKGTVLWIGALGFETDVGGARCEIAFRSDVIAGEKIDGVCGHGDDLVHAEPAVGVVLGGARHFEIGATDPRTARYIVPNDGWHSLHQVTKQRLSAFFDVS